MVHIKKMLVSSPSADFFFQFKLCRFLGVAWRTYCYKFIKLYIELALSQLREILLSHHMLLAFTGIHEGPFYI